jgi:hypothetical membrane protein
MAEFAKQNKKASLATRLLLACGAIGPLLFILVFLVLGATRPGYNPYRHPISSLSIGDTGWIQAANFLVTGLCILAFAIGVRRSLLSTKGGTWGPLLIGLTGIGFFGAGIFTTDPLFGYPASTTILLSQYTVHGHLHDLCSILVFLGLPAACFVFCRRFVTLRNGKCAAYSLLTGLAMLATSVLASIAFMQSPSFVSFAGVFQRVSVSLGLIWLTLLSIHSLKVLK